MTTMIELMTNKTGEFGLDGIIDSSYVENYYSSRFGSYKSGQSEDSLVKNWDMQNQLLLPNLKLQLQNIGVVFDKSHVVTYHKEGNDQMSGTDTVENTGTQNFKKGTTVQTDGGTDTKTIGTVTNAKTGSDTFSEGTINERTYETAFDSAAEKLKNHFQHDSENDTTTYNTTDTVTHSSPDTVQYGRTVTNTQNDNDVRTDNLKAETEYGKRSDYEEDYYGSGTFNPIELLKEDIKLKAYDLVYQYLDRFVYGNFYFFYSM